MVLNVILFMATVPPPENLEFRYTKGANLHRFKPLCTHIYKDTQRFEQLPLFSINNQTLRYKLLISCSLIPK
jgi:hypothetical protein